MKNILNEQDLLLLRRMCNYLGSLGMSEGIIDFYLDEYEDKPEKVEILRIFDDTNTFSNNYRAGIPVSLHNLLKKVLVYSFDEDLFVYPGNDGLTYANLEIKIDCDTKSLTITQNWGYYEAEGEESIVFDIDDDEKIGELFTLMEEAKLFDNDEPFLELRYDGSGDSGYIQSEFDETNDPVPSPVEDWCYDRLETNFGGWEINEGSQGRFLFYPENKTIELLHSNNVQMTETESIFETKFSKK